ncbi:MAG: hypothetical protein ACLPIC_19445 [Rhodoblastus sp.]|uniref:hypothetical protein n=2 Tax=Rhodoblastus sp. TaxID=1962975 RepID=UPI003F946AEA
MGNIEQTRRYFKAWSDRDADAVLATFIEGGTYQDCMTGGPVAGDAMEAMAAIKEEGIASFFEDVATKSALH